ncbi:MAG: hypothetical protein GOVbin3250_28 [Prokaryotic dsDNA virus sp.]|nr:MAG: hypothetical protein GOVbin3250_28 [Prokaryotic dsDNA virus sp.]|tara:strand:+ start:15367 stop:15582 length:216 start_codon:yes stop_codon:yes gene_type:complete
MTQQEKIQLGTWLEDNFIAHFYPADQMLVVYSEEKFDELDCILDDMGIEYNRRQCHTSKICNEYCVYITLK